MPVCNCQLLFSFLVKQRWVSQQLQQNIEKLEPPGHGFLWQQKKLNQCQEVIKVVLHWNKRFVILCLEFREVLRRQIQEVNCCCCLGSQDPVTSFMREDLGKTGSYISGRSTDNSKAGPEELSRSRLPMGTNCKTFQNARWGNGSFNFQASLSLSLSHSYIYIYIVLDSSIYIYLCLSLSICVCVCVCLSLYVCVCVMVFCYCRGTIKLNGQDSSMRKISMTKREPTSIRSEVNMGLVFYIYILPYILHVEISTPKSFFED